MFTGSHDPQVINSASGRCWSSEIYNPCPGVMEGVPSSNDYLGGFGTALMTKVFYCAFLGDKFHIIALQIACPVVLSAHTHTHKVPLRKY